VSTQKTRLLIVEDEPTTRALLTQIFAGKGHSVRAAEDGFAALEELRKETPDILLSDLNMPRMSGFELLSVVRRRMPGIFVIATSGAFSGDVVPNGIAADAFHEKATGLAGLFEIVKTAAHVAHPRIGTAPSTPIWITPSSSGQSSDGHALISCQECLRSFSLAVGAADFIIHETNCVYCNTTIHYATVQPMNPALPHHFHPDREPARATSCCAVEADTSVSHRSKSVILRVAEDLLPV
jgi:CheY-like chemotaxis protein